MTIETTTPGEISPVQEHINQSQPAKPTDRVFTLGLEQKLRAERDAMRAENVVLTNDCDRQTRKIVDLMRDMEAMRKLTFESWLKQWVDERAIDRVNEQVDKRMDRIEETIKDVIDDFELDPDKISGLDDMISDEVESQVRKTIAVMDLEVEASDVSGLDEMISTIVDDKINAIVIQSHIVS